LSGGEKRSVGTARALLKAPSILLLDEPTEGLDAQNEKEVMHNLLVGVWFNVYLVTACVLLVYCLCTTVKIASNTMGHTLIQISLIVCIFESLNTLHLPRPPLSRCGRCNVPKAKRYWPSRTACPLCKEQTN
jgi:hypothetical protein